MSPADLATLSLLDPDQGVCPGGHRCRFSEVVGERVCLAGEYRGHALVCWDLNEHAVGRAELQGAKPVVVVWARSMLDDRQ